MWKLDPRPLALAAGLTVVGAAGAEGLSDAQHRVMAAQIEATLKLERAGCERLVANAKDICLVEAKGRANVATAEATAQHRPSAESAYGARVARVDADYKAADERCDDRVGGDAELCFREAREARGRALAAARARLAGR